MYGPGSLQTAASVVGLGASEIVHGPFKRGISVSSSSPVLLKLSPVDFQKQVMGAYLPVQIPRVGGAWCGAVTSHFSGRTFAPVIAPLTCECQFRGLVPDLTTSLSLFPFLMWLRLHTYSCLRAVLRVFRSFFGEFLRM